MSAVLPLPGESGHDPRPVAESLDRVSRSLGGPPATVLARLFSSWTELVGEAVAAHARPRALRRGVLVLAVDEPAWATQLRWLEARLLERVGEVAGEGVVTAIEVRVERP